MLSVTEGQPNNFVIEAFHPNPVQICAVVTQALRSGEARISCVPGVTGSTVKIKMIGIENRILALREVEVFGVPRE